MKHRLPFLVIAFLALFSLSACQKEAEKIHVQSITLPKTSVELIVGEQISLDVTVAPENATDKSVSWSSSNEAVATVSDAGLVMALSAGSAVITVTTNDGGKTVSCAVSVDIAMSAETGAAEHITFRGAVISGKANIPSRTTATDLEIGVLFSTSSEVIVGSATQIEAKSFDSEYNYSIHTEVLEPETAYYYRSYISQSGEITYGDTKSFKTLAVSSMIQTEEAAEVKTKSATLSATLDLTDINYDSIEYGFELTPAGGTSYKVKSADLSSKKYSFAATDLQKATSYTCMAYVTLDGRTYYGNEITFNTDELKATVSLNDASDITEFKATITGSLTVESEGSFTKSAKLYYSSSATTLSALKSVGTAEDQSLAADGSFTLQLSGLNYGTKYYYVAVAQVDDKEFVSAVKSFTTKVILELVDLGLSVKWRSWNLGASKPEEYGLYYQWGDTQGYGSDTSDGKYFYWNDSEGNVTYKWCNGSEYTMTKYNTKSGSGTVDNKTALDMEDDAARVSLGGNWRMPTDAECAELMNFSNCSWTWTTINGVKGYKVQSLKSGYTDKWIFLPAAGCRYRDTLSSVGSEGYYWSSSLITSVPFSAYCPFIFSGGFGSGNAYRYVGHSVRPVSE